MHFEHRLYSCWKPSANLLSVSLEAPSSRCWTCAMSEKRRPFLRFHVVNMHVYYSRHRRSSASIRRIRSMLSGVVSLVVDQNAAHLTLPSVSKAFKPLKITFLLTASIITFVSPSPFCRI
ncbi:hypothetical protein AVEN_111990-1 [Araneus ventricosus]|uniref:Uncharacterized protein n=1 Tax=Araneus ventricosus TaxID=182803 RepID=A0A4Y2HZQ6_ARAVE|nr:hypothetical protein AVEN_111990-1 [Araneus ventricosus]